MENLNQLLQHGWRHHHFSESHLATKVELSRRETFAGRSSLRLKAAPLPGNKPPLVIETPPLWITSAPLRVRAGQLVRINGWVKLSMKVPNQEGLVVFDSLGGFDLAERIHQPGAWQSFTLYRAVPRDGELSLTFVLTGLGDVFIDNVTVQVVDSFTRQPTPALPPQASRRFQPRPTRPR